MKRKKTGSPVFFLCLKFSTYRIFSGKSKKFRLVIGIFGKKQFLWDIGGKNKVTKSVETIRFLHYSDRSPLWWLAPPPLPRWEACHWILSRLRLPTNPVPLPPRKRWDNKALQGYYLISSTRCNTVCSAPACGGSPAQPDRGCIRRRRIIQNNGKQCKCPTGQSG